MKKRVLRIILAGLGCMLLASCDDANTSESRGTYKVTPAEASPAEAKPTEAETENKPTEAVLENVTPGDGENEVNGGENEPEPAVAQLHTARKEGYMEILDRYKEAQDNRYSEEELENMGFQTELIQHGWPFASNNDEVGYLYYDVDSDGEEELIITYYGAVIDIYGYDGSKVRMAFSTPYRSISELYPGGMLRCDSAAGMNNSSTGWYQFDTVLGDYFPVFCAIRSDSGTECYTYCYYDLSDEEKAEIVDSYEMIGSYPVWIGEWSDMISEEEYNSIIPKDDPIKLPQGEKLAEYISE